jgi:hypothetical protein
MIAYFYYSRKLKEMLDSSVSFAMLYNMLYCMYHIVQNLSHSVRVGLIQSASFPITLRRGIVLVVYLDHLFRVIVLISSFNSRGCCCS